METSNYCKRSLEQCISSPKRLWQPPRPMYPTKIYNMIEGERKFYAKPNIQKIQEALFWTTERDEHS